MTITRVLNDGDEADVDGEVSGTWCAPEPDVGVFGSWFEDVEFVTADGQVIALTAQENYRAQELLSEEFHSAHRESEP
jgi:hypothetical protein